MPSLIRLSESIVVAVSYAVLSFSVAQAGCSLWDAGGEFTVEQSNGYSPVFDLVQQGSQISGSAHYEKAGSVAGFVVKGTVGQGSNINGANFHIIIIWDNDTRGSYSGTFDSSGKLTGTTFDELHPTSKANWSVNNRQFACLR
jgi:hypothetical protein